MTCEYVKLNMELHDKLQIGMEYEMEYPHTNGRKRMETKTIKYI